LLAVSRTHEREIAAIGCENALDLQAFRNRNHGGVDKTDTGILIPAKKL
jgi:hypothetical protein